MAYQIDRSALVLYSSDQMYQLINDVPAYPAFLPWCSGANILSHEPHEMIATLEIAKGAVRQQFTTRNRFHDENAIHMELLEGPFKYLRGVWRFVPLQANACKVVLQLDFDFSGTITKMALGTVFNQAANTMVDAFCRRASEVYG